MVNIKDLPERIVVGKNGAYWRDYGDYYSMCPVSEDNDPVEVVAIYQRIFPRTDEQRKEFTRMLQEEGD